MHITFVWCGKQGLYLLYWNFTDQQIHREEYVDTFLNSILFYWMNFVKFYDRYTNIFKTFYTRKKNLSNFLFWCNMKTSVSILLDAISCGVCKAAEVVSFSWTSCYVSFPLQFVYRNIKKICSGILQDRRLI